MFARLLEFYPLSFVLSTGCFSTGSVSEVERSEVALDEKSVSIELEYLRDISCVRVHFQFQK
jgi:hypothetical protein